MKQHTPFPSLPKEIVFAVQSALSRKTFLRQVTFALAALHALDVPGSVQHVEQKAVQDRPLAAGAVDHGFDWANNPTGEVQVTHTNGINSTGRALTEYLPSPRPIRLEHPGQCARRSQSIRCHHGFLPACVKRLSVPRTK